MTPALIIEQVAAEGVRLTLGTDGNIKAVGDQKALTRWLPVIKQHKPGIVAALRSVDTVTMEPTAHTARTVYWESASGHIIGGVKPELLAMVGQDSMASFWILTTYQDSCWWVRSDRLRSRTAFEEQPDVHVAKRIPRSL